jgi:hypothetical protein
LLEFLQRLFFRDELPEPPAPAFFYEFLINVQITIENRSQRPAVFIRPVALNSYLLAEEERGSGLLSFLSRRKHKFHGFRELAAALVREVNTEVAVLDGELAMPDQTGRTVFAAMTKHRQQARFLRYRTVKAERLDSAMARLDAVINTPRTPANSQLAKSLTI